MRRALGLGCLLLITLVVLGGGTLVLLRTPSVSDQLPIDAVPMLVTLQMPANDSSVPLGQPTTITSAAIGGNPILALELWTDGSLYQKSTAPPGAVLYQFAAFWTWTPPVAGEHTLLVRARDADGNVRQSNLVRVSATKAEPSFIPADYAPQPGESVPAIAAKLQTTAQAILDLNPQLNPTAPLGSESINIPVPLPVSSAPDPESTTSVPPVDVPPAAPAGTSTQASGSPAPWWFWLKNLVKANQVPTAPSLWAKAEACSIHLTIQDSTDAEEGYFIYRLAPEAASFERTATLGAHSSVGPFDYVDSDVVAGDWQYYVTAFNTKGESASGIVKVGIGSSTPCAKMPPAGVALNHAKLIFTPKIDKAYCYVALNDGKWTRMPPSPSAFVVPDQDGSFDASPWINQLPPGDVKLSMDCWGWLGNQLEYLGKTEQSFSKDQKGPVQIAADKIKVTGELGSVPAPKPMKENGDKLWLAPPINFKLTGDAKACADHMPGPLAVLGGAFACQAAVQNGYAVLVWDWQTGICGLGAGCQDAGVPDGYHVYREGFPTPYLFKEVKGIDLNVSMFPYPAPPWGPPPSGLWLQKIKYELDSTRCYTVRAFKNIPMGVLESDDSKKLCLGDVQVPNSITLKPAATLRRWRIHYENCPTDYDVTPHVNSIPGPVAAGYEHRWYNCDVYNVYHRGAVWFDLSQVPTPIMYATLQYNFVDSTTMPLQTSGNAKLSCADYIMLGTDDWRGNPYGDKPISIPAEDYVHIPSSGFVTPGQPYWIDVTTAVNQWLSGQRPNYGFVLRGFSEDLNSKDSERCDSVYDDFELKIQRYGQ